MRILAEWVDSKIELLNLPGRAHQELNGFLQMMTGVYVSYRKLGTVLATPFTVKLANSARHIDIIFISQANTTQFEEYYLVGAPDVAVEIVSRSRRKRDNEEKFREYKEADVREYWRFDPAKRKAQFYRLNEKGKFQPIPITGGVFISEALPGFTLRTEWLWEASLTHVPDALREMQLG